MRYATCDKKGRTDRTDTNMYLRRVANDPATPLRTNGVAWHPYQQCAPPSSPRSGCPYEKGHIGIGDIDSVQETIGLLKGRLRTFASREELPNLFLTEFGLYNRSPQSPPIQRRGHSESRKRDFYRGAFRQALTVNARVRVRLFIVYRILLDNATTDDPSTPVNERRNDDTGSVRNSLENPTDPRNPHHFGTVRGNRGYATSDQPDQQLRSYCDGLLRWTRDARYRPVYDFATPPEQRPADARC